MGTEEIKATTAPPPHEATPRARWLTGIWLAGVGALYLLALRPTIGWNDAPEFVDVAFTLGIPHPPGSPTYCLLAKIAALIPLGAVAARVNVFSLLCALGALGALAAAVARLHRRLGGEATSARLAGILAGSLLAVAPTFLTYATDAVVYAPFALVTAALLYLGVRWDETLDDRFLLGGAFLFGLSGGIHGTSIFFAPALALFVWRRLPRERWRRTLPWACLFGMLGASVFLYLPLRAATEPSFNWGHPDTWARFWMHVSDRKDGAQHFGQAALSWWPFVPIFARNVNAEFTPWGWGMALGGIAWLLVRARGLAVFSLLLALGNVIFFLRLWTIPDAYLPTFVILAFWAGIALARVLEVRTPRLRPVAAVACIAAVAMFAVQARGSAVLARARLGSAPRSAAEANLLPLAPGALAFVTANWFPMRYLQDVEGLRPDVSILLVSDLTVPRHFTPVTRVRFPKVVVPAGDPESVPWDRFFRDLLDRNVGRAPVYWEPLSELNGRVYPYLHPWRYLWRFDARAPAAPDRAEVEAYFADLRDFLGEELSDPDVLRDPDAVRYHAYLIQISAQVLRLQGRPQDALVLTELAERLTPDNAAVANELGRLYDGFGRHRDAERMFRHAATLTPGDPTALLNIAILQMSLGRLDGARETIRQAMRVNPRAAEPWYQLSQLERRAGRPVAARQALSSALDRTDDKRYVRAWREEMRTLASRKTP